jgi:hypothetical protein
MSDLAFEIAKEQAERIAELEAELTMIANAVHHGGLLNLTTTEILSMARKTTLPYWDKAECERLQALEAGDE